MILSDEQPSSNENVHIIPLRSIRKISPKSSNCAFAMRLRDSLNEVVEPPPTQNDNGADEESQLKLPNTVKLLDKIESDGMIMMAIRMS